MKIISTIFLGVFLMACSLGMLAMPQGAATDQKPAKATPKKNAHGNEGEQRFRQNCGRCHNPPESLSPREVKAVMQHMRVRAILSAEDEQLIMKYLAP